MPVALILPRRAQAVLVHAEEVGLSACRSWLGMAAGTENFGTMKSLAVCCSGSDNIASADAPHTEFLRPSGFRSVDRFCVNSV